MICLLTHLTFSLLEKFQFFFLFNKIKSFFQFSISLQCNIHLIYSSKSAEKRFERNVIALSVFKKLETRNLILIDCLNKL